MKDVILYHGSRGGIEGNIEPISRVRCDFGKGFYMGENAEQAKSLVSEDVSPVFYTLKFRISEIPEDKILYLKGQDWIYAVLANRRKCAEFNHLKLAEDILNKMDKYDVIVGAIADDRMNEAMQRFSDYALTDKGLQACLQSVDYGMQYVAKSKFACSKIDVISERAIYGKEADDIRTYTMQKRAESRDVVRQAAMKYQRQGEYLNEIIEKELLKEKQIPEERKQMLYERDRI